MGDRLGGQRYELVRELGRGAMGIVYEAIDHRDGARVALKTLRQLSAQAVYRLKQEFRLLQGVEHPNLVGLRELVEEEGRWFFTMELIPGTDLLSYVRPAPREVAGSGDTAETHLAMFDEARVRHVFRALAEGVSSLHGAGKIHRDIKPSNIRVTPEGRVVLLDFGLVVDAIDSAVSRDGTVVGTPAYMAPEQAASQPVGPAADWYAVGAVLYEALTGMAPFTGTTLQVVMDKQQREPPAPNTIAPGIAADLSALCAALLRMEPERRPEGSEVLGRLGAAALAAGSVSYRTKTSELFGRETELALLERALAHAEEGVATTVYVVGESGVGKTALTEHFAAEMVARDRDSVVLRGRCYEREWVPYKGLDGVVDALSRFLRSLSPAEQNAVLPRSAALMPRVFPVLGRVEAVAQAPPPPRPITDPQELRTRAFAALREMLQRVAERRCVLIVIDDLQWADSDSLLLLADLLRPPDAPPVLVICTSREPVEAAEQSPWLIELQPLEPEAARLLARSLLEREGLLERVSPAMIAAEALGHPLYVDELVRYVASLPDVPTQSVLKLDDAIRARVALLPDVARLLLELAAVAGTPLPDETLSAACRAALQEVTRALSTLRAANLLRGRREGSADILEPYHDRVREAVVDGLDEPTIVDRHRRIAAALENTAEAVERPEMMVAHLTAIGDLAKAADYARRAAVRAEVALAFDRAADHLETAVELSGGGSRELRLALADAVARAGRGVEAAELYLKEYGGGDGPEELRYLATATKYLFKAGHLKRGFELIDEVCAEAGIRFPTSPRRALWSTVWQRCKLALRGSGWRERSASDIAPRELAQIDLLSSIALGLSTQDTLRAADFITRWLLRALRAGEPRRVMHALAMYHGFQGTRSLRGLRASRAYLQGAVGPRARASADSFVVTYVDGVLAMLQYYDGDHYGSVENMRAVVDRIRLSDPDMVYEISTLRFLELTALRYAGRIRELGGRGQLFLREAVLHSDRYVESCVRLLSSLYWLARDDLAEERRNIEVGRWPEHQGYYHLPHVIELNALAERHLYAGTVEGSQEELERRIALFERSLLGRAVWVARHEANWTTARVSLALAAAGVDTRRHRARVRRIARGHEKTGVPRLRMWSLLERAALAAQASDPETTVSLLREAAAYSEAAQTLHLGAAARRRLGALLGGDEGAALIAESDAWMAEEGIVDAGRFTEMLAPGF